MSTDPTNYQKPLEPTQAMHSNPLPTCVSIIAMILLALALVSCGNSAPSGYLGTSPTSAWFIAWTNNNGQLTGTLQIAYLDNSFNLRSQTTQLTGVLSGSNVSLTLSAYGFPTATYVGTLENNVLTLAIPNRDGTLQTSTFGPATSDDYNTAVGNLQATATSGQSTQIAAQALQAEAQATSQAQEANAQATSYVISSAQSQLNSALSSLQYDSNFSSILDGYSRDITSAQNDLQQEQKETDCSLKKGDESLVEGDASLIQGDDSLLNSQLSSANSDIQRIQQASQVLNQSMPDISQYTAAISDAKSKATGYDNQMQQLLSQAKAAAQC